MTHASDEPRWSVAARPVRLLTAGGGAPVVFVVALVARLWVVIGDGGFGGNFYYDPAVYYAAADALTHGRMPYHDFVLIHPPMIALVTAPFALLGRLTTDHAGFIVANMAYTVLSAVNAVLVTVVARAFGLPRRATLAAGLFYALWIGSITAEFLVRLEPLGNFFLLVALLALAAARRRPATRAPVWCGVLFGCLLSVKIWWIVPVVVILVWQLGFERAVRRTTLMVAGIVGAGLAINGPFLVVAGRRMFRAIVSAQLERTSNGVSVHGRIDKLSAVSQVVGDRFNADSVSSRPGAQVAVMLFCVLGVACAAIAARTVIGRVFVTILAAELAVFLVTATWFYTYCDYLAVPLALTIAAAAAAPVRVGRAWPAGAGAAAALTAYAGATAVATFANGGLHMVPSLTGSAKLARGVAGVRCVVADTPMALIELNALDRSFTGGCRDWVDLTGVAHGGGSNPRDLVTSGRRNARWSADLCRYLTSGDAVVVAAGGTWHQLPAACARRIRHSSVLVRSGTQVVHRIAPSTRGR